MTEALASWPDVIWDAAVLRGLDARARSEIEAAGELLSFADGACVFREGEPADAFYVVERGEVRVRAVARGDDELRVIRDAKRGEAFGEDATLRAGGSRRMEAVCVGAVRVARVPAPVFARAALRGGGGLVLADRRRALERAATMDLLRTMAFTRRLDERERETLLDAGEHVTLARGEHLYRTGEPATHVYFVADGMLQLQTEDDGRLHVRAYVSRGDVLGEAEIDVPRGARRASAVATGAAHVLGIERRTFLDVARAHPGLLDGIRRVVEDDAERQRALASGLHTTHHVFKDLYRFQVARSLLVIDQDSCVRCGHCAWSCADVHDDGVSRLLRRGDKLVARVEGRGRSSLLVPNSCQHCENPACMPDCPTGAIGRDPRGEVFIREELCTGCGACAKGCPWDNIQMAPRTAAHARAASAGAEATALVAVKCDLCSGREGGPACVASCPTEAIARIRPDEAIAEVRGVLGARDLAPDARGRVRDRRGASAQVFPARTPTWPAALGGALVGAAALVVGGTRAAQTHDGRMVSGAIAATLVVLLAALPIIKRVGVVRRAVGGGFPARAQTLAHVGVGVALAGIAVAHAGVAVRPSLAGALAAALGGSVVLGALGALVWRAVPGRLARIERDGALPEDLAARAKDLEDRTFRELSGKSELVKAIFAKIVQPYRRSPFVAWVLVASGRTLREERDRLRARVDCIVEGRSAEKLAGLDDLLRVVVEQRAITAQRALSFVLRAWMVPHVVLGAVALVLLVLHAAQAAGYR